MADFEHNSKHFGYVPLDDLEGVQNALNKLGYEPGKADGLDGPRTQGAVRKFQTDAKIRIDGIAGPETKGALLASLDAKAKVAEAANA
jgi:peptidoglycan hydrolase-like protein with peptidoglycan-binding domain